MSSKGTNGRPKGRVRFSDPNDDDNEDLRAKKRPRPNDPEEADINEPDDDDDDDDDSSSVPSSKALLEAKRIRRLQRQGQATERDTEKTHIDNITSLMLEETSGDIPIEAFTMEAETNDGSGFFDESGTYVFRKRNPGDEPDAWLESLENQDFVTRPDEPGEAHDPMDDWTKEELYAKILPLVSDHESVLQALVRYGNLIKRQRKPHGISNGDGHETHLMAQSALNDLTEASNALLLKGDVDVYQMTREGVMNKIPEPKDKAKVQWEYQGNQDNQVHGPYTTQEMMSWTQAGYFIGEQAVKVRNIKQEAQAIKSTKDELLSDLMDDDDDGEIQPTLIRGDWVSSNDVNFNEFS